MNFFYNLGARFSCITVHLTHFRGFLPRVHFEGLNLLKERCQKSICRYIDRLFQRLQGSHRLEKYLNIQYCLEKSLKMKFSLKSTGKTLITKALKSP